MARQLVADRLKRQQLSRSKAAWTVRKDDQREQSQPETADLRTGKRRSCQVSGGQDLRSGPRAVALVAVKFRGIPVTRSAWKPGASQELGKALLPRPMQDLLGFGGTGGSVSSRPTGNTQ